MDDRSPSGLPRGTVTLLFTDIEGSTPLLSQLGNDEYARLLADHRRVLRAAFKQHGGIEVDTQGDSFFAAFPTARGAVAAAAAAQDALDSGPIRVRIGIHTGTPELTDEGYVGADVHRAARIAAAAHGGQTLLSAATAALLGDEGVDHGLRDLGSHRLRGLETPERLHQLGAGSFPPLRTEYQANLPLPATPLIGREREIAAVLDLMSSESVRLVTLTGPGGTGKTRLALAVAAQLVDRYPDGVWWVPLAALRDPALVIETAARVLGARADLAGRIGARRMLLLFDNFEQVLGAAGDVADLLAACPNLDVLVTSRAPLRVLAEHEYDVPPLATGEAETLFVARARAAGLPPAELGALVGDAAVAQICRRLDELPLAIELAAARLRVYGPAELLARLDHRLGVLTSGTRDQSDRHRTLSATIEWSYELLRPEEQELFARLSLFRGGCDLDAAQRICDAQLDGLVALIEQSLLRRRGRRYVMLETIRELAAERLAARPDADDLQSGHADYFLALAEEGESHLFAFSGEWLERLAADHDNLRAALDHYEARGRTQDALRLAGALQRFWIVRGHLSEGLRRLRRLLELDARSTAARGKALNGAALLALNTGDPAMARSLATEARGLHDILGDRWGQARSAFVLGSAVADARDFEAARSLFEESLAGFAALGDEHNVTFVTSNLSWVCRELGDEARARELEEETLRRARALGNDSMVALSLSGMAMAALADGNLAEALSMMREALAIDERLGDVRRSVDDFCRLSRVLAELGPPEAAGTLLAAAERLHMEIGASVSPEMTALNGHTTELLTRSLPAADRARARRRGEQLSFADAYALARGETFQAGAESSVG